MENVVDALKIAFGVMMFVLALTLSISSFSKANSAVTAIVRMNDRETEYTYVEPSASRTREVGVETIIPTMYRAHYENIEIKFLVNESGAPLNLYSQKNIQTDNFVDINYINEENSNPEFLDELLKTGTSPDDNKYKFIHPNGLYNELIELTQNGQKVFKEEIGEYYAIEGSTQGKGQIKTRVITYTLIDK